MRAKEGPLGSIEQLHADFAGPLYLFAWRRLGDRRLAEEAVQETLLRAWRNADRFDPERGTLPAWLFTIARNTTTDRLRHDGARPDEVATLDDVATPPSDGDIDRALEAWQLADALHELSDEHRNAIVEVHYLGYTVREVAERYDLPEGTVKSRVYYGLRALRLKLEERGVTG
ncbi:MAG: sigma-70 family RNA polymerase sigma factor [Nitriliruptorales bacterium]|nr:sigma-70 family RNA polymerase sigma factor [Nitriliruptorales bacterium]